MSKTSTHLKIVSFPLNHQDVDDDAFPGISNYFTERFSVENSDKMIGNFNFEPSKKVVKNILSYSKALRIHPSESGQPIKLILN